MEWYFERERRDMKNASWHVANAFTLLIARSELWKAMQKPTEPMQRGNIMESLQSWNDTIHLLEDRQLEHTPFCSCLILAKELSTLLLLQERKAMMRN